MVKHELFKHNYYILQVEIMVYNCILHHHCMPFATLLNSSIFSFEVCAQGLLLCVCLFICVNNRWSIHYWVVTGESWCTTKDIYALFPDVKDGYVHHLLFYNNYTERLINVIGLFSKEI